MKRNEDLAKENELLKKELKRREVEENLRRQKEKEMEEKAIEKFDTSIVDDTHPVNPIERESEIEEELREKQEETQKEPNPTKGDDDTTGNTLEEQKGKNMEKRREAFHLDDEEANSIPESSWNDKRNGKPYERSSDDEHEKKLMEEGKVHGLILNQARRPPTTMKMRQGRRLP